MSTWETIARSSAVESSAGATGAVNAVSGRARASAMPTRARPGTLRVLNGGLTRTKPAHRASATR